MAAIEKNKFFSLASRAKRRHFPKLVRAIPKTLQSKIKIFEQRTSAEKMKNEKILA